MPQLSTRTRIIMVAGVAAALVLVAVLYVVQAASHTHNAQAAPVKTGTIDVTATKHLLFRNGGSGPEADRLASVSLSDPSGPRTLSALHCVRVYAAGGTGLCLTIQQGAVPKIYAQILDRTLHPVRQVQLAGAPSRARVSASGRMLSWTVFVSGDSYTSTNLSTRTGILDTQTGHLVDNIESFALTLNGKRDHDPSLNYWGVTFAKDDDHFYATVRAKGTTYLIEGSMRERTLRSLHDNVECPSISPDGTRLVFKKATGDPSRRWRLTVLDLATLHETPLAETRSIDDQAAWLDDSTILYGRVDGTTPNVWAVQANGQSTPRLFLKNAYSPAPIP
jgi:hypothetical protein